jgi:hypothetical protein
MTTVNSRQSTVDSFWKCLPALIVVAVVLLTSTDALACSVCFDPKEERRMAFMITTIILTVLPLSLVFGTIYWLRKTVNKAEPQVIPPAE